MIRCPWPGTDPLSVAYHDEEWGVPVRDDRRLFEFLVLESAQAGLSWITILRKREGYRKAFAGFDPAQVAEYTPRHVDELVQDAGIVRNRKKIEATIRNAQAFLEIQRTHGSFSEFVWDFVGGRPLVNRWRAMAEVPPVTPVAEALSKELKRRGFSFLGPTVMYAHMQATGLVNDHLVDCFRWKELSG